MNLLPIEVLTRISSHLSFSDRKYFALVCKRFNISIYFKELWQDITYVIGKGSLNRINTNFLNVLTSIKLFSVSISPEQLHCILKCSSNLRDLALVICLDLFTDNERFQRVFVKDIFEEVRDVLAVLRLLNLSGNRDQLSDVCLNCLLGQCRQLQHLDLSELDIYNISDSWSPLKCDSHDWSYHDYLSTVVPEPRKLTFANVIGQIWTLRHSLTELRFCSTHIEYEEVHLIATMPQLCLAGVHLDQCKGIDARALQTLVRHQATTLCRLSLQNTFPVPLELLEAVLAAAPRLKVLGARVSPAVHDLSLPGPILALSHLDLDQCTVTDHFVAVLNRATTLVSLALRGCDLRAVRVTRLGPLPRLRRLDLARSHSLHWRPWLADGEAAITTIVDLCLDGARVVTDDDVDLATWPHLERVSLVGCAALTGAAVTRGLRSARRLAVLRLQGIARLDDECLAAVAHVAPRLRHLDLSGVAVTDGPLLTFLGRCRRLRTLRLDHCPAITDHLRRALPRLCPYLQDVSMRHCDNIDDPIELNYHDHRFLSDMD